MRVDAAGKPHYVDMGVLDLRRVDDLYEKLHIIFDKVCALCDLHHPDDLAIESPFYGRNAQVIFKLGRAQGAAMAAALTRGAKVYEYAPRKAKQAICGNGAASKEQVALMVEKTIAQLKEHNLYTPERILFISFSKFICEKIAAEHPQFVNQFLSADPILDEDPAIYAAKGINGVDYHYKMFKAHPEWVRKAHSLGMSVNAWTVNKEEDIKKMIEVGVDAITTNEPLLVRDLLSIEYKKK